jgi:hypothetical protein
VLLRQTVENIQTFSHKTQSVLVAFISPTAFLLPRNITFYIIQFTNLVSRNIIFHTNHFTNFLSCSTEYNFLYDSFHQLPVLFQGKQFCRPPDTYNFLTYSTQKATLYVLIPLSETSSGVVHIQVTSVYRASIAILRDILIIFQH